MHGWFEKTPPSSAVVVGTPFVMVPGSGPAMVPGVGITPTMDLVQSFVAIQLTSVALSATPTVTPIPSQTPTLTPIAPTPELYTYVFSYYYPDLGPPNCHADNWDGMHCKDITASGQSWFHNLGKGFAAPPWWKEQVAYGTVITVTEPKQLAGDWIYLDDCALCAGSYWKDGIDRLDFLMAYQAVSWETKVTWYFKEFIPKE